MCLILTIRFTASGVVHNFWLFGVRNVCEQSLLKIYYIQCSANLSQIHSLPLSVYLSQAKN